VRLGRAEPRQLKRESCYTGFSPKELQREGLFYKGTQLSGQAYSEKKYKKKVLPPLLITRS
jgi:hypothetical protein